MKRQDVRALCQKYGGTLWSVIYAQCWRESRFNEKAHAADGGMGISQFMPATWKEWAGELADPYDPDVCLQAHAKYFTWLVQQWKGDRKKAIASYNHGIGNVQACVQMSGLDWERALPASVRAYLMAVLDLAEYAQKEDTGSGSKLPRPRWCFKDI